MNIKKFFTNKLIIRKLILIIVFVPLIISACVALGIANDLAFNRYDKNITAFFANNDDLNQEVIEQTRQSGNDLAREIVKEGAVLVKNKDNILPLSKGVDKVNVFGHSSTDWFASGGGSGAVSSENDTQYNIPMALEKNGVSYNHDLYNFYRDYRGPVGGNNPVPYENSATNPSKAENICVLAEPELKDYDEELLKSAKSFSDTAIMCMSRKAGESEDIPHAQYKYKLDTDFTRGYLTISKEEEDLLNYLVNNYTDVIVLINSTNVMQLDFVDEINGIDACLVCGATGNYGANGVYDLLYGLASPSAKLTDTYARKLEYNPSFYHGGYDYINNYEGAPSDAWPYNRNYKSRNEKKVFYVDYIEGIYVGYKWFETADKEGFWDKEPYNGYSNVVQYPFGYGMSYTSFSWELDSASLPSGSNITSNEEIITYKVKVTNTGEFKGKDVVEVYLTAPYYPGEIEKSYVSLVGFAKTPELESGQAAIVEIKVRVSDFESYDCYDLNKNGHTGYELDKGEYLIKFMSDSHNLKEEMTNNTLTYNIANTINVDVDEVTGQKVDNLFTGKEAFEEASIDGSTLDQNVEYLTRANFVLPTSQAPNRTWNTKFEVSRGGKAINTYSTDMRNAWDNKTGLDFFGEQIPSEAPTWGNGSGSHKVISGGQLTSLGLELADKDNWDSKDWDDVLNQISWNEAMNVVNNNAIGNDKGIPSCGRPDGSDADGPQQIGAVAGIAGVRGTAYPSPTVTGQTWSKEMAYSMGKSYGKDMQAVGRSGAYAFGCNIHRSAYTGRNFEYFSEDPFLSGMMAANASKGVAINGKYCFMKHFVCNDQEYHRVGLYTWLTEQALREVYLKPFKEAVLYGELSAMMTSFNRVGSIWAGGNEALLTGVVRKEWQFHGMIITDYGESDQFMDQAMAVRAGSNYGMAMTYTTGVSSSLPSQGESTPRFQHRVRECCKEIIYGYIHPLLINHEYNESDDNNEYIVVSNSKAPWEWWKPALVNIDVAIAGGLLFALYVLFRPGPKLLAKKEGTENE